MKLMTGLFEKPKYSLILEKRCEKQGRGERGDFRVSLFLIHIHNYPESSKIPLSLPNFRVKKDHLQIFLEYHQTQFFYTK